MFVVDAYFKAERISVLADHPCYHWVSRESKANASLDALRRRGLLRQRGRGARPRREPHGAGRVARPGAWPTGTAARCSAASAAGAGSSATREYREELYAAVRRLALERYDEGVHERMGFNLRVRSKLLRAEEAYQPLELLARYETRLRSHVRLRKVSGPGTHLVLRARGQARRQVHAAALRAPRRRPHAVGAAGEAARRDRRRGPRRHRRARRERGRGVPARTSPTAASTRCPRAPRSRSRRRAEGRPGPRAAATTVPIAPTAAAAGSPLPPGQLGGARGRQRRRLLARPAGAQERAAAHAHDLPARADHRGHEGARRRRRCRAALMRADARLGRARAQADAGSSRRSLPGLTAPRSRRTARRRSRMPRLPRRPLVAQVAQQRPHAGGEHGLGVDARRGGRARRPAPAAGRARRTARGSGRSGGSARGCAGSSPSTSSRPVGSVPTRRQIRSGRWRASTPRIL